MLFETVVLVRVAQSRSSVCASNALDQLMIEACFFRDLLVGAQSPLSEELAMD